MSTRGWRIAWWTLFVVWLTCAALGMGHVRAGLLTSYGADLAIPAWLYIATRSLHEPERRTILRRVLGATPELAAGALFLASTLSEISQWFWPRGLFRGRFDPFDILAYALGLAVCYALDKRSPRS